MHWVFSLRMIWCHFISYVLDYAKEQLLTQKNTVELFAGKQRQYDLIPPTQAALKEHAKRASYEAGYVWGQALKRHPQMPSPSDWGWVEQDKEWKVFWTPLPPIAGSFWELTKCWCTKACTGRCKCFRYGLGLAYVVAPARTYLHVSFVILRCPLCFQV